MNNEELIKKAERGEWDLECDKKVLDQMKNVAQKLESRSANTKTNIDSMVLGVDELKVKLNNLSKINSIRNTHYCENVLREEDPNKNDSRDIKRDSQKPTKQSQQVAIDNGIKLMEKCFDKHVVKLDPSSSDSETTIFRPIDKYANVLPHLIGSDDWNRKWHAGILDKNPEVERRRKASTSSSQKHEEDSSTVKTSNLGDLLRRESLESVAKSVSSASGEQMVINSLQPSGIFSDNNENELNVSKEPIVPSSSSSMFRPQPDQRRIINLFNDEPPSIESSPAAVKKPVNLFDDYGSVDSFPSDTSEDRAKSQIVSEPTMATTVHPPVDLFDDNEFENFIDKLEKQQGQSVGNSQSEKHSESVKSSVDKNSIVGDMKKIADEIKKVQLKKVGGGGDATSVKSISEKKLDTTAAISTKSSDFKQMLSKTLERQSVGDVKSRPKMEDVKSTPPPPVVEQKTKKQFANLFDDEDDNEVASLKKSAAPKQLDKSAAEKPKEALKKKLTNLFDDDDDDDPFENIFKKKNDAPPSKPISAASKKLFDDEHDAKSISTLSKSKSLFDDEQKEVKTTPPPKEQTREAIKTFRDERQTTDEEKHIEKSEKVFESEKEEKIDAEKYSKTIQSTSSVANVVEGELTNIPLSVSEEKLFTTSQEPFKKVTDAEKPVKKDEIQSSPFKPFNVPFLSDVPPEDDTWNTEDNNFDEHDNRVNDFNTQKLFNYSSMPLFDELPPEDDFSSTKPPVPEPNFYSDDEEPVKIEIPKKVEKSKEESVDEMSSNPVSAGIRGKLDHLFKKQQEKEAATVKDSPKKLPGKLSSDLKINVGALMPGMRPPSMKKSVEEKSPNESFEKKDEESEKQAKVSVSTSPTSATDVTSSDDRLNLLNNDLTKSRAKIQVKRRPSTRKARQESYKNTMSSYITEESKEEEITTRPMSAVFSRESVRKSVEFTEEKSVTSSKKILSSSIFGDESDSEDLLANVTSKKIEGTMTTKISSSKSSVVTNKIPVFYDDEADTKKMLDEQKKVEKGKQEEDIKSKIFGDESDDDLFGRKSTKPAPQPSAQKLSTKSKSLFDDEDDEEDLFASSKSTKKSSETVTFASTSSSKKLFESDDDDLKKPIASSSKPKTEKSISKSLFGDDDDDDDLFSSKPKSSTKSTATSIKSSSTIVKKTSSKVVEDPLSKDIWND